MVGLNAFTDGGVTAAGQRLMDIVPDHSDLIVGARVAPDDADDIAGGQAGELRIVGMHDRGLPIRKRTALEYAFEPLNRIAAASGTEHKAMIVVDCFNLDRSWFRPKAVSSWSPLHKIGIILLRYRVAR